MGEFREATKFWVNSQSPALSSVGRRCMEQGMSFVWPTDSRPYFVTPWGTTVPLVVDGYIPYLYPGSPECRPEPVTAERLRIPTPVGLEALVARGTSLLVDRTLEHPRGQILLRGRPRGGT